MSFEVDCIGFGAVLEDGKDLGFESESSKVESVKHEGIVEA